MVKLIKVYHTKRSPKLRARIKVGKKIMSVHCGKSLPKEVGPGAYVSEISRENDKCHIDIKTDSAIMRIGFYTLSK